MTATQYDVVVIGAGINGAGVAQAAAAAGYRVLLLEKSAPAAGTSSKSSKLVHGGLRAAHPSGGRSERAGVGEGEQRGQQVHVHKLSLAMLRKNKSRDGDRAPTSGGREATMSTVRQSKKLSWLLRHGAQQAGLAMDEAGWAAVPDVLRIARMSHRQLRTCVAENNKKRLQLEGDRVRCTQGHSLDGMPVTLEGLEASWAQPVRTTRYSVTVFRSSRRMVTSGSRVSPLFTWGGISGGSGTAWSSGGCSPKRE